MAAEVPGAFKVPTHLRSLAHTIFGEQRELAERYAHILGKRGAEQGLIGPREVDRIWERHLMNCALMTRVLDTHPVRTLADVGSGAGLPGLVLAIARPGIDITLIETMQRRVHFLNETVRELDLSNVEVVRARAEDLHGRREFQIVTARAVAALDTLATWTLPLVAGGGELIALKGQNAASEVQKAAKVLARLHGSDPRVEVIDSPEVQIPTTVVRVSVHSRPAKKGATRGR